MHVLIAHWPIALATVGFVASELIGVLPGKYSGVLQAIVGLTKKATGNA